MSNLTPNQNLLLEYDKIFDKTNAMFNQKNKEINTKTKLVEMNNLSNLQKTKTLKVLQYIFGYLVLSFVIVWFYHSKFISLTSMIIILVVLAGVLFSSYYINNVENTVSKISQQSAEAGEDMWKTFEESYLSLFGIGGYSCQEYCIPETSEEEVTMQPIIQRAKPRYIRQDSQRDVWLKGDLPTTTYTIDDKDKMYRIDGEYVKGLGYDSDPYLSPSDVSTFRNTTEELEGNKNQRTFIPLNKNYATYYNCKFLGGEDSSKVPYKYNYQYTTIPCHNYPGFVETEKYICKKDPKQYGVSNCTQINSE